MKTPYKYSFNNPTCPPEPWRRRIAFADPSGADPDPEFDRTYRTQNYFHNGAGSAGYPGLTYDDVVPQSARGEFNSAFGWRQDTMLGWFAGGGSMFDRQGGFGRAGGATLREMAASAQDVRTGRMSLNDYALSYGSRMSLNEGMQALASYNEAVYQTLSLRATYSVSSGKFFNPMVALWRVAAEYLRNSAVMLAATPSGLPTFVFNPLYKAEAVYWDAGWSFVGHEGDKGGFLILAGEQAGEIHEFTEKSMAALSIDAGAGMEFGRVDILDKPERTFTSNHFYGYREKVWGSYSFPIAAGAPLITGSVSLASSVSYFDGAMVVATSIGLGVGIGPTAWSAGWNNGFIKKRD